MIIAFSPEQLHEVAQAFDAPWWMNESLFPEHMRQQEGTAKEPQDKKPASDANDQDAKPAAETPKKACRRPNMHCRPNKAMFAHCQRYNQAARCRRQAQNQNKPASMRTIEQKTPIHMHEETPDAARMSLDVTGFAPEDITIHVENYVVSIKGQRTNKLGDVFVLDRRFRLDKNTASVDRVAATFEDGILELTVPKKCNAGPRQIPIVVAAASTADSETQSLPNDHEDDEDDEIADDEEAIPPPPGFADSSETVEEPQSAEEPSPLEEEQEIEMTVVETVNEDKAVTIEEDNKTHTTDVTDNKSKEDDDTWEEVLE